MNDGVNNNQINSISVRDRIKIFEQNSTPTKTKNADVKATDIEQNVLAPQAEHIDISTKSIKSEFRTSFKQSTSSSEELKSSLSNVADIGLKSANSRRPLPPTPTSKQKSNVQPTTAQSVSSPPKKELPDLPSIAAQQERLITIPMRASAVKLSETNTTIKMTQNEANAVTTKGTQVGVKNRVMCSAVNISQDYKSGDPRRVLSAQNKMRGLSNKNLKTLFDIIDNKNVSKSKINNLDRAINKPSFINTFFNTISTSKVLARLDEKLLNVPALSVIDATYETDGKGIVDVAYANQHSQFAYVVDGTGHGNALMAEGFKEIFDSFNAEYEENRANQGLNREFVVKNLGNLESKLVSYDKIINDDPGTLQNTFASSVNHPAMSFVQIIPGEGDNRTLISAQYNDTMFMVMHKKSSPEEKTTFYENDEKIVNTGVGSSAIVQGSTKKREELDRNKRINDKNIAELHVKAGDVVYLFSDGIGEFLTKEEIHTILDANVYPHLLLDEFKNKIIAKGIEFREEVEAIDRMTDPIKRKEAEEEIRNREPANKSNYKHHDPANKNQMDDLSLAILKIT